jgi:hypothetical protein
MSLPNGTTVDEAAINEVCDIINFVVARDEEISQRLNNQN